MRRWLVLAAALAAAAPAVALEWAALPFGYYTTDTGPALGAYAALYFRPGDEGGASRLSYVQPMVVYTWKRQFRVDLNADAYSPTGAWRVSTENRFEKYPSRFWPPPGAENVPKEFYAGYTPVQWRADVKGYRRASGPLYGGLGVYAQGFALADWAGMNWYIPGPLYAPGAEGGVILGPQVLGEFDTRDLRNATTAGNFARVRVASFSRGAASDYSFRWYELDARVACPLERFGRRWTFANRFLLSGRDGAPPFWAMPTLGGSALLRGEPEGRARGRWLAAYQEEVRVPLFWRVVGALFADVGDVGYVVSDFSFDKAKMTGGGGVRVDLIPGGESRVRLDVGKGKDSVGVYLVFNEAF